VNPIIELAALQFVERINGIAILNLDSLETLFFMAAVNSATVLCGLLTSTISMKARLLVVAATCSALPTSTGGVLNR
jgi:hypothetical protein